MSRECSDANLVEIFCLEFSCCGRSGLDSDKIYWQASLRISTFKTVFLSLLVCMQGLFLRLQGVHMLRRSLCWGMWDANANSFYTSDANCRTTSHGPFSFGPKADRCGSWGRLEGCQHFGPKQ